MLLFEHTWASELKAAIRTTGGFPIAQGFLTPEAAMMVGAEVQAIAEAEAVIELADAISGAAMLDAIATVAAAEDIKTAAAIEAVQALMVAGLIIDAAADEALAALLEAEPDRRDRDRSGDGDRRRCCRRSPTRHSPRWPLRSTKTARDPALLAILGVPIWLIVGALGGVLWSRHQFRAQEGCSRSRSEPPGDDSWPWVVQRGRLTRDICVVNRGPAQVRTEIFIIDVRPIASVRRSRRCGRPRRGRRHRSCRG